MNFGIGRSEREDFDYEREQSEDGSNSTAAASLHHPISETNAGFQMLLRLGWTRNTGLGREGRRGRLDPVPFVHKADKEGVGKTEEAEANHVDSTRKPKALESEVLANETSDQRAKREALVESRERVKEEIRSVTRAFYCELCDKQYTKISEFEVHLSSYDHNHKKRFKDMQQMTKQGSLPGVSAGNKRAREDKEKAREEREFKRMHEAALLKEKGSTPVQGLSAAVTPALNTASSEARICGSSLSRGEFSAATATARPLIQKPPEPKVTFGFGMKKQTQPIKFSFGQKKQ
ncbi:G patch domain-containing protein 8 [Podochytrium sp. JEL0797]|nr:G patch domain-containing protein 8 [Podochytrium sp. JEL0797]